MKLSGVVFIKADHKYFKTYTPAYPAMCKVCGYTGPGPEGARSEVVVLFSFRQADHQGTDGRNVALLNTNVRNVKENGYLVIRGQIWLRSAPNVELTYFHINQIDWMCLTNQKLEKNK